MIVNDNNNIKSGPPPADSPPAPPGGLDDSLDSQPELSFNLELSLYQQEHYGTQFSAEPSCAPPPPPVTIVGKSSLDIRCHVETFTVCFSSLVPWILDGGAHTRNWYNCISN